MYTMSPKIAIVTRTLTVKGGAERTILELAKYFKADIYTSDYNPSTTFREFSTLNVYFSPLIKRCNISLLLKFLRFPFIKRLREYDLIITSSGFYPKLIAIHHNLPPIIHYEQSPTNFSGFARLLSPLDKYVTKRIKKLIANSRFRKKMLDERYGINCEVIYPPVDIAKFKQGKSEDFFLSVQRITPDKRVDIQIKAFKRLPTERLVIVGHSYDSEYFEKLKKLAPSNVEFKINVDEDELIDLYARCKATIQTSKDEHFGLVPVESMAAGKPCIAVNEGGFRETIIHGKTGILIDEPYVENLIKAIKMLDEYNFDPKILRRRAYNFSPDKFVNTFKEIIKKVLS